MEFSRLKANKGNIPLKSLTAAHFGGNELLLFDIV